MQLRKGFERFFGQPSQAMPVAIVLALLPIPHWIGMLVATIVLLRAGGTLSYLGYVGVLFAAYASEQNYTLAGAAVSFEPFMTLYAPIGVMAFVLRYTRSLALSLEVCAYILTGLIIGLGVLNGPASIESMLTFFEHRRQAMGYTELDAISEMYSLSLEQSAFIMMLFWPVLYLFFQALILLLARYCQAALYVKGGFAKDFQAMRLSKVSAALFGALFVAGFFLPNSMELLSQSSEYVMIAQLSGVALCLLSLVGLGMAHRYVAYKRMGWWALPLLYASIILLGPVTLAILVVLALADAGLDLRRRLTIHAKGK